MATVRCCDHCDREVEEGSGLPWHCRHCGPLEEAETHAEVVQPTYVALDCPAWINGKDVLLAARKSPDPEGHTVIALLPGEARGLHERGRLDGWEPTQEEKPEGGR